MNAKKITDAEAVPLCVASLPSRPTSPTAFGGKGFTASEMKAAFDKLPLLIIERYNTLIDDIGAIGSTSLAAAIPSGIYQDHTLANLFDDIRSSRVLDLIEIGSNTLRSILAAMISDIGKALDALGIEKSKQMEDSV